MLTRRTQILICLLVFTGAFALTYELRYELEVSPREIVGELVRMAFVVSVQLAALWAAGGHKFIWRFVGVTEIKAFIYAALLSALPLVLLRALSPGGAGLLSIPYSVIIMDICFAFGGTLLLIFATRAFYERNDGTREARLERRKRMFREIQMEDLLGRDSVQLDEEIIGQCLTGKRIMVTGAGGSIGAELVRQIARFHPAKLLLVERAEFFLFNTHRELEGQNGHTPSTLVPLLADINDAVRMRAIFEEHRPQVLLHAAAHKHVPMAESNPAETVRNNVLATNLIGELAGEHGVEVFVLISTDKAVNPTSVMGASKRAAELVVQSLNQRFERTRYLAVRFGNVIGSTGSVIPIFQEQICKGGPVTVTDERMMRYFMTIQEAAQLVLQAGSMGCGGEIFILKMGRPLRIYDLAREMILRSGLRPGDDIEIRMIGGRPGEKLIEELESSSEQHDTTRHPRILIGGIPAQPPEKVSAALEHLDELVKAGDGWGIRVFLNSLLPEARLGAFEEPARDARSGLLAAAGD